MQRRGDDSIRGRISRALGRQTSPQRRPPGVPPTPKRRVPRREIEARRQRMLRWGVAIAGAAIILVLVYGVLNENVIKPNQTLATVGTTNISRQDYWKSRAYDLYEQALQYQQFAQVVGPDQQGQYLALAQQSLAQIPAVWGNAGAPDKASLEKLIEDQIYLQGLDTLGLTVTPEEVHTFALNRFAPPGAPLLTPVPTPTLTAARAAIATRTAEALLATPVASPLLGTPLAGTPAAATPMVATPVAGTPGATPAPAIPTAEGAPSPADARATAEAGFARFEDEFFSQAHLTPQEYERLIAAPALARQKVQDALAAMVGQSAPQVRAAHILVPTEKEAREAYSRVTGGEEFATVARELSTDTGTAGNGGELGWFTREEMVAPFADAAFAMKPGEISEPVQSEFGWHVIKAEENDPDRPLTNAQITRLEQAAVDRWVAAERDTLNVSSTLPPSPNAFCRPVRSTRGRPTATATDGAPINGDAWRNPGGKSHRHPSWVVRNSPLPSLLVLFSPEREEIS